MTDQDLQQIGALITAAITAAEQRITAATAATLSAALSASEQRMTAATAANLSDLREELSHRMQGIEDRLNNFALTLFAVDQRTAGHTRVLDDLLKVQYRDAGTALGLARTVEQLAARVAALEARKPSNPS